MSREIPVAVIAVVSDVLATRYTHSRIDYFMEAAGLKCDPPFGNKVDKTRAWLRWANENVSDPLATLGRVITEFMEVNTSGYGSRKDLDPERERVNEILAKYGFSYSNGGYIFSSGETAVSKTLQEIIRARDLSGLQTEFDRISHNVESDPASAVTASCALLESLFRSYIEDEQLAMPTDRSIKPLWKVIRADLKLDPAAMQDDDLKTVLTGLAAIIEGVGSLRTHKGSAHGHGKTVYKLKPRHARLVAHASFTLASFLLEAWNERTV
ncbi:MAG: abortive infection family protein [Candidatus Acidiferrales bacterium]